MLLYTNRTEFHSIIENKDYPQIPYCLINFFLIYFYYVAIIVVVASYTSAYNPTRALHDHPSKNIKIGSLNKNLYPELILLLE